MSTQHADAVQVGKLLQTQAGALITVLITVDAATILQQGQGANPAQVITMVDNNAAGGSTGEGTYELNTACHPGDIIQWRLSALDGQTSVGFLAFRNSSGTVFSFNPPAGSPSLYQAEAIQKGNETYQIEILVGGTQTFVWDPFVTCT